MERVRERSLSLENHMFGESRKQRQWYRIKDLTGKILERGDSMRSFVERDGEAVTTRPDRNDSGDFARDSDRNKPSKTYSLRNVIVEGDVRTVGQK